MQSSIICLALVALSCSLLGAEACSCVPASMRQRNVGCQDEFMAVVNVTGVTHSEMRNVYSFKLIDDRTPALAKHESLTQFSTISSNDNSAACGVHLDQGVYLLKGSLSGAPHLMLCGSYWKKLDHVPTQSESKAMLDALYVEQC